MLSSNVLRIILCAPLTAAATLIWSNRANAETVIYWDRYFIDSSSLGGYFYYEKDASKVVLQISTAHFGIQKFSCAGEWNGVMVSKAVQGIRDGINKQRELHPLRLLAEAGFKTCTPDQ